MADRRPQDPTQLPRTRNKKRAYSYRGKDLNLIRGTKAKESLTPEHGEPVKKTDSFVERTAKRIANINIANIYRNEREPKKRTAKRIAEINDRNEREAKTRTAKRKSKQESKKRTAKRIAEINERNEREAQKRTAKRITDVKDRDKRALKRRNTKEM